MVLIKSNNEAVDTPILACAAGGIVDERGKLTSDEPAPRKGSGAVKYPILHVAFASHANNRSSCAGYFCLRSVFYNIQI